MTWSDSWTYKRDETQRDLSPDASQTGAKTYRPSIELFVGKTVYREGGTVARASKENQGLWDDLAWYLGDGGSVSIQKSIHKPCGSFVITIPDQPVSPTGTVETRRPVDSLHALLEPTDGMSIYLARNQHEYMGGLPPILMRGFVRDIVRQEVMGPNGKPHRVTSITGQDYGAVFDFLRLCMSMPGLLGIPDLFKSLIATDIPPGPMPINEFYEHFVRIANNYLDGLFAQGGHTAVLKYDCTVTRGLIPMLGLNAHEGPLWGLMLREMDSPWNELFVEDREDAPYLVYRPTPYKNIDGEYIPNISGPTQAYTARIDISDVVSLTTHRGDYDAANLFYTDNPTAIQSGIQAVALHAAVNGSAAAFTHDTQHQNNDPTIYGDRLLRHSFRQWPNNTIENPTSAKKKNWEHNTVAFMDWWEARTDWLRMTNRDNIVFETGTMTVKGSEHIRPGMYLRVRRGSFEWECYTISVTHDFLPLQKYTTTVHFIRGTGFVERLKSGASPYLREGKRGPYDRI